MYYSEQVDGNIIKIEDEESNLDFMNAYKLTKANLGDDKFKNVDMRALLEGRKKKKKKTKDMASIIMHDKGVKFEGNL